MPKYDYMPNNKSAFPHVGNVDVYAYDNGFDYSRFDCTQMDLQICTVPWDMGEAHIGNRTISGIGNVVHFGDRDARDGWFDSIPDGECYRFSTKYKELHRDRVIDVPVPYDMCARHNYLKVHYNLFANDESPVEFEGEDGVRDWFWFIREVEFVAPNTTRLHLLEDAFQTWIYDVDVTGMVLERGHAPMFAVSADDYLKNPLENNGYLLTEDVNFGEAAQVSHVDVLALNSGNMSACIATTAIVSGASWADKVPGIDYSVKSGVPSVTVFAIDASDLPSFLTKVDVEVPQFKQTVKGIFFASSYLLDTGSSFTFASTKCYTISARRRTFSLTRLSKSSFGYDSRYSDIAKLYTWPYAHIEVTDENGDVTVVKIEDTEGHLEVSCMLSLAYPYVSIDSHLLGAGGNAGASVTFRNVDASTFDFSGRWYDTLKRWNIPTFAVVLDASKEYGYSTKFDRAQRMTDYTTAQSNANASAATAKANADASADTAKANADANADAMKSNADASATTSRQNAHSSADTSKANVDASADTLKANADESADTGRDNAHATANTTVDNGNVVVATNTATTDRSNLSADTALLNSQTFNNKEYENTSAYLNDTTASTIAADQMQSSISATSSMASGVAGAVTSAMTGNIAGAMSNVVNGMISAETTRAHTVVGANLTAIMLAHSINLNHSNTDNANNDTSNKTSNQKGTQTDLTNIQNSMISTTTANSAATAKNNATLTRRAERRNATRTQNNQKANATRTQDTEKDNATRTETVEKANATRSRDTMKGNATRSQTTDKENASRNQATANANAARTASAAQSAIDNDVRQAALRAPFLYGDFKNGETAATRPVALFSNIVTQPKGAIRSAGDYMLRYGYAFDGQWDFDGEWNIGKHFTYWKLSDFWVKGLNVPDMYMDRLRFFLFGGVTVWRNPEDIGNVSIYDNMP